MWPPTYHAGLHVSVINHPPITLVYMSMWPPTYHAGLHVNVTIHLSRWSTCQCDHPPITLVYMSVWPPTYHAGLHVSVTTHLSRWSTCQCDHPPITLVYMSVWLIIRDKFIGWHFSLYTSSQIQWHKTHLPPTLLPYLHPWHLITDTITSQSLHFHQIHLSLPRLPEITGPGRLFHLTLTLWPFLNNYPWSFP